MFTTLISPDDLVAGLSTFRILDCRAALGDPWVFSGRQVTAAEAARFLLDYTEALRDRRNFHEKGTLGRTKKLLSYWTAGGLFPTKAVKDRWLREQTPQRLWAWLEERARSGTRHKSKCQ